LNKVEIWDLRRTSSSPVTFITAHPTKISNIDWNSANENELITSSADGTVKFWDVKKSRICQGTIATGSPVVKVTKKTFLFFHLKIKNKTRLVTVLLASLFLC
jgi:WD40 repeat protein